MVAIVSALPVFADLVYNVAFSDMCNICAQAVVLTIMLTQLFKVGIDKFTCIWQAEEITLTVGQAFDLAYKRFLESSSKDMDVKKQFLLLQKKVRKCRVFSGLLGSSRAFSGLLRDSTFGHENSRYK